MARVSDFERLKARIAAIDPLIVEAVDEVDVELLRWSLSLSPRERLRAATIAARTLKGFRRFASAPGRS